MVIDLQRYWGERQIYFTGELASKIIYAMQTHRCVVLRSKEVRNAETSGLFRFLDQLCEFWQWDKHSVTLETANVFTKHDHYDVRIVYTNEPFYWINPTESAPVPWDGSKLYGMFIGRANVTRLRAIQLHRHFDYCSQGLTSFNHDLRAQVDSDVMAEFLMSTDTKASELLNIRPYSDIGTAQKPPITIQFGDGDWKNVYRQIPIEIVCATGEDENTGSLDEKIIRPILHRRPFLYIGSANVINDFFKNFRDVVREREIFYPNGTRLDYQKIDNLRFFENAIPLDYDKDHGVTRVEHVFDILRELIRSKRIYTLLDDCAKDIEWNYQVIMRGMKDWKNKCQSDYNALWDYASWKKPNYD